MGESEQRRGEEMGLTVKQRQAVMEELRKQYHRATKKEKTKILDGFVDLTHLNRSYARTTLRAKVAQGRGPVHRPRASMYTGAILPALTEFWHLSDRLCGKRLVPFLQRIIPFLETRGQFDLAPAVRGLLLRMSPATCDRLLQDVRTKEEPWEHPHPRPGMLLLQQVPVQTAAEWDRTRPGFVAVDLVTHEGSVAGGEYACTLDVTDVVTGWTETRAVRNKSQEQVFAALRGIRSSLPFPLLGIHSDNGSEFMNNHLIRYCHQQHITLTRSRPYRKNDNCFVEQKNWSIVRRTVWYLRYDTEEEVLLMNKIYQSLRLFTNFFLPVMQLTHKTRQGAKVTRSYDAPCTPYERVLASPCIPEGTKEALRAQEQHLDPVALHERILADQRRLRELVLTKKQVQPHINLRKGMDWQLHPVSSRF